MLGKGSAGSFGKTEGKGVCGLLRGRRDEPVHSEQRDYTVDQYEGHTDGVDQADAEQQQEPGREPSGAGGGSGQEGGADPGKGSADTSAAGVTGRVTTRVTGTSGRPGEAAGQRGDSRGRKGSDSPSPSPARREWSAGSARRIRAEVLEVLSVVRVARSEDLRLVLTPGSARTRYVRRALLDLLSAGLVGRAQAGRWGVWFLTRAGLAATDASGDKADIRPAESTGAKVARSGVVDHALAVTGVVTAMAAHGIGGVRDWQLERAHRFDHGRTLIVDLVLQAPHLDPSALLVELDRDTMRSTAMGRKLELYTAYAAARFWEGQRGTQGSTRPYWSTIYSGRRFPPLLVVVDGDQAATVRRAQLLHRLALAQPASDYGHDLTIGVTSLNRLRERGPLEPIWIPVGRRRRDRVSAGLEDLVS